MNSPARYPAHFDRLLEGMKPPPRSMRSLRYRGDDRAVRLSSMDASDRRAVRAMYRLLAAFEKTLIAPPSDTDTEQEGTGEKDAAFRAASSLDVDGFLALTRTLGRRADVTTDVRHALHDVRGGALTSLLMEVQRARRRRFEGSLRSLKILTSDHLKIMRNALLELDDVRRDADLVPCAHTIDRLSDSLSRVTGDGAHGPTRVHVRCDFVGAITMSCVELGALDRAALNLVNNAVRHAADDTVDVVLLPVASEPNADLRVLVANRVTSEQTRVLYERFGDDLTRLYLDPYSTTGSGEGLKICVEFVAAAFGLVRETDAVASGLVGAKLDEGWFVAWFHWPSVA